METGTDAQPDEEQTPVETEARPIPVLMFEGEVVTDMEARLPAITVEMPEGYERGTHLRMNVEFRVKGVRYEERKGSLVRQHILVLESAAMVAAFKPEEAPAPIGGSASGTPTPDPEAAAELGLQFGRTSDTWEQQSA